MKRAEAEKLLGGYATGTLTEAERRVLFETALADQALFDALADEEALRELLADPAVRRRLLAVLAEREAGLFERLLAWWRRPVAWGVAGSVAVAALLVVMLLPVYQATKRPALQPVVQVPEEMAKKVEPLVPPAQAPPPVRTAPAPRRAAERPREQGAVAASRVAERTEQQQFVAEAKPKQEAAQQARSDVAVRESPVSRPALEKSRDEAMAAPPALAAASPARKEPELAAPPPPALAAVPAPKPAELAAAPPTPPQAREAARGGVVGGVVGGIMRKDVEADARVLYYGPAEARKAPSPAGLRAQRAAVLTAGEVASAGLRYTILKQGAKRQQTEVAPGTVFAPGDVIFLSVEANQSGVLRLTRQDAARGWGTLVEIRISARERRVIPPGGLRLAGPEVLELLFRRAGEAESAAVAAGVLQSEATEERAVYAVAPGGAPLRVKIELRVQ